MACGGLCRAYRGARCPEILYDQLGRAYAGSRVSGDETLLGPADDARDGPAVRWTHELAPDSRAVLNPGGTTATCSLATSWRRNLNRSRSHHPRVHDRPPALIRRRPSVWNGWPAGSDLLEWFTGPRNAA